MIPAKNDALLGHVYLHFKIVYLKNVIRLLEFRGIEIYKSCNITIKCETIKCGTKFNPLIYLYFSGNG